MFGGYARAAKEPNPEIVELQKDPANPKDCEKSAFSWFLGNQNKTRFVGICGWASLQPRSGRGSEMCLATARHFRRLPWKLVPVTVEHPVNEPLFPRGQSAQEFKVN